MKSFPGRIVLLILITSLLFAGCAHKATVIKPADSGTQAEWVEYYKDQFKAHGDDVPIPGDDASNEQRMAYTEARDSFKTGQMISLGLGVFVLLIGLGSLLGTLSQL